LDLTFGFALVVLDACPAAELVWSPSMLMGSGSLDPFFDLQLCMYKWSPSNELSLIKKIVVHGGLY
jgi:hypothetical protein